MNAPFSPESLVVFYQSLAVMGKGMLGIFVFMTIFYGLIITLEKCFKANKTENK